MRNNSVKAQLIYRTFWLLVAIVATVTSFTDHLAATGDGRPVMLFFTTWSTWLAALVAVAVFIDTVLHAVRGAKQGYNRAMPVIKFSANIVIIATFIVSAFVLPDKIWMAGYWNVGSIFKHFLLPILTVLDCVLFDPKNHIRISYPFLGVILPLLYWIVVVARIVIYRNACGGAIPEADWNAYYPYGFTNFDNGHTLTGLCGLLAGIMVGLIAIGFLFWVVDKLSKKDGRLTFTKGVDEDDMNDAVHYFIAAKKK